jgi:hypothetical protein
MPVEVLVEVPAEVPVEVDVGSAVVGSRLAPSRALRWSRRVVNRQRMPES